MLDRGSNYVTTVRGRRFAQTANREVVGLSSTRRKDDLILLRANQRCDFAPRACWPKPCTLEALPNVSTTARAIAFATRGSTGVVAQTRWHAQRSEEHTSELQSRFGI